MKKKVIRAGIIGSGFAARFHFEALTRVHSVDVKIVGAYSRNTDNLRAFTSEKEIESFESLEKLIAACDILHVCTPPSTHEFIAIEVLKQNKDVII